MESAATDRQLVATYAALRLFALVRTGFEQVSDQRAKNIQITMPDALMSGFAMFSLKDPSLLTFEERRETDSNLKSIYDSTEKTQNPQTQACRKIFRGRNKLCN